MKNTKGLKIVLSVASVGFMFLGIYQFAFASTFGGMNLYQSDRSSTQPQTTLVSNATEVTFTAEELAKYNGTNGNPAYVAVDGIVYNMTSIGSWTNGQHQGLSAGQDLSAAFASSPHSKAILDKSPIVGKFTLVKAPVKVVDSVSTATVNTTTPVTTVSLPKTWTLDAVSKFNGIGGNPAYIIVNGKIYDVTSIGAWNGGVHKGIRAGQDVTTFFASSPHSASLLSQLPVIGNIGDNIASNVKVPTATSNTTTTDTTSSASLSNSSGDDYDDEDEDDEDHDEDEDDRDSDDDDEDEDEDDDDDDSHDD